MAWLRAKWAKGPSCTLVSYLRRMYENALEMNQRTLPAVVRSSRKSYTKGALGDVSLLL